MGLVIFAITTRKILFSDGLFPMDIISLEFFDFSTNITKGINYVGVLIFSMDYTHKIGIRRKIKFLKTKEVCPSRLSHCSVFVFFSVAFPICAFLDARRQPLGYCCWYLGL